MQSFIDRRQIISKQDHMHTFTKSITTLNSPERSFCRKFNFSDKTHGSNEDKIEEIGAGDVKLAALNLA
jgi:hypothetical protein